MTTVRSTHRTPSLTNIWTATRFCSLRSPHPNSAKSMRARWADSPRSLRQGSSSSPCNTDSSNEPWRKTCNHGSWRSAY